MWNEYADVASGRMTYSDFGYEASSGGVWAKKIIDHRYISRLYELYKPKPLKPLRPGKGK